MVNLEIFTSLEGKVHSFLNTKFSYLDHCTWTTKMSSKNVTTHPLLLTMEKKLVKRHYQEQMKIQQHGEPGNIQFAIK